MKIRFGMLAVDAYGKAGGQCIQRRGSIRVLRNITIPTQRLSSTQNPQRFINSTLFNKWQFLSADIRSAWDTVGSFLTRVNGWGDGKTLTGREAYVSLNSLVLPFDYHGVEPLTVTYEIPYATFNSFDLSHADSSLDFSESDSSAMMFYQIKAVLLRSAAVNVGIEKLKTFWRSDDISDSTENWSQFLLAFPTTQKNQVYSIAIRPISTSGIPGVWTQQTVKVD